MMTLTTGAILGVDVLLVQQLMVSIAGIDAWIALGIGGLLTIVSGLLVYALAAMNSDKDYPQILLHLCGKVLGRLLLLPTILFVLLYTGLSLRVFAQALKMFLLDMTPIYAIVGLMLLVASYTASKGIYTIGGVVDIIFPVCIVTVTSLMLLSLQQVEPSLIRPIMFENTDRVLKGIIPGFQMFTGHGLIAYILCYTKKVKGTLKWYLFGLAIPILVYIGLTILSIMVFGAPGVISLIYPTLTLTKSIEFPATFLERLESIAAILWIGIIFVTIVLFTFSSIRNLAVFFHVRDKHLRYLVLAHIPVLLIIALVIKEGLLVMKYFRMIRNIQVPWAFGLIPLLTFFSYIKKRRGVKK
jgi:spore germination protein